jgi:small subunit ribosomal protein S7e
MATLNKIAPTSPSRQNPSELETSIAQALYELETNIQDLRSALRPLQFVSAREVRIYAGSDVFWNIWAIFRSPPWPPLLTHSFSFRSKSVMARKQSSSSSLFLSSPASIKSNNGMAYHFNDLYILLIPIHSLTRELEKKFSDRHVLILASRRILPRPKRSNRSRTSQTQKRPRSRTLTAVHDAILADVVYPVEIVGKRIRTREDGSKLLKVVLDEKERGGVDYRLDTYGEVYRKLTGRGVGFEFPQGSAGGDY